MRAITGRPRRLETRLTRQVNQGSYRIYERRRRRLEREGVPFAELPPDATPPVGPVPYLSAAETLTATAGATAQAADPSRQRWHGIATDNRN